jgi:hypothetical protein
MIKIRDFWKQFWIDERDYYGDIKASAIYLTFSGFEVLFVVGAYWWMDKL